MGGRLFMGFVPWIDRKYGLRFIQMFLKEKARDE
jgi:hypothetical protein